MRNDQLATLSADFVASYISCNFLGVTRTVNRTWVLEDSLQVDLEMKKALQQGTFSTLNIYFVTNIGLVRLIKSRLADPRRFPK
jgi:hypothetical protein